MEENKGNEAEEIKPDSVDDTGASEIQSELHLIVTGQPVACLSFYNLIMGMLLMTMVRICTMPNKFVGNEFVNDDKIDNEYDGKL